MKYVNLKRIFSTLPKAISTNYSEDVLVEWAVHALDKIGGSIPYSKEIAFLKVDSNTAILPADVLSITGMVFLPEDLIYSAADNLCSTVCSSTTTTEEDEECFCTPDNSITNNTSFYRIQNQRINASYETVFGQVGSSYIRPVYENTKRLNYMSNCSDVFPYNNCDLIYLIQPNGSILFNFSKGVVLISYEARAVDENDYPLIPEIPDVIDCINSYLIFKDVEERMLLSEQGAISLYQLYLQRFSALQQKAKGTLNLLSSSYNTFQKEANRSKNIWTRI